MTTKQKVIKAVQALPEDASIEDAMERLLFLAKVEKGLSAGRCRPDGIPREDESEVVEVRWILQAADDLDSIVSFISKDSEHYARLFVVDIFEALERIASFPRRTTNKQKYAQ